MGISLLEFNRKMRSKKQGGTTIPSGEMSIRLNGKWGNVSNLIRKNFFEKMREKQRNVNFLKVKRGD